MTYINDIIREELAAMESPDKEQLASRVTSRVVKDGRLLYAFNEILPQALNQVISAERQYSTTSVGSAPAKGQRTPTPPRPSRWARAATAIEEHYHPVFKRWESISRNHFKFLGDCTKDDVLAIVEDRTERASAMTAAAESYRSLLVLMEENGASKVSDLDGDEVERVLL